MPLFGKPDIKTLVAKQDAKGLVKALKDPADRNQAIAALVHMGEPAVEALIGAFNDPQIDEWAMALLVKIGAPAVPRLIQKTQIHSDRACMTLVSIGPAAIPGILDYFRQTPASKIPMTKFSVLVAVVNSLGQPAVESLKAARNDACKEVRDFTGAALKLMGIYE